jgi:hypothetical protein
VNKEKLKVIKKGLSVLIKKMGSNLLSGKSPLAVSMPVFIFEKRSNL